ncbi:PD-(D/E)XK nuclease family protein [Candidatus Bathyarchaeota archaeon]|nr:PD-(D/E)XK nuclease family protein [Candidatus Bathyarchaeota archaeon]
MSDLYLDSTAIKCFLDCREAFRLRYIENLVAAEPSFHQAIGIAVHLAAETHNRGGSFEDGLRLAADELQKFPENLLNPYSQTRFRELAAELPSMVACYFDEIDNSDLEIIAIEEEWSYEYLPRVFLCGRKDKVGRRASGDYVLFDLKTASEIGKNWKAEFRGSMLRDFGLALYDWHESRILRVPSTVKVECLVKPYKTKEPRIEIFDLPEITAYRKRFEQQLAWVVNEIVHYHNYYKDQHPWPMAQGQCLTKYGPCEYLKVCCFGRSNKILSEYIPRTEHLEVRRQREVPADSALNEANQKGRERNHNWNKSHK